MLLFRIRFCCSISLSWFKMFLFKLVLQCFGSVYYHWEERFRIVHSGVWGICSFVLHPLHLLFIHCKANRIWIKLLFRCAIYFILSIFFYWICSSFCVHIIRFWSWRIRQLGNITNDLWYPTRNTCLRDSTLSAKESLKI